MSFCSSWSTLSYSFSLSVFSLCILRLMAFIVWNAAILARQHENTRSRTSRLGCWRQRRCCDCRRWRRRRRRSGMRANIYTADGTCAHCHAVRNCPVYAPPLMSKKTIRIPYEGGWQRKRYLRPRRCDRVRQLSRSHTPTDLTQTVLAKMTNSRLESFY